MFVQHACHRSSPVFFVEVVFAVLGIIVKWHIPSFGSEDVSGKWVRCLRRMKYILILCYVDPVMWFSPTKNSLWRSAQGNARVILGESKKATSNSGGKKKKNTSWNEEKRQKPNQSRKTDPALNVWPFPQKERQIEWEREKASWWNPFCVSLAANSTLILNMVHSLCNPSCPHTAI